MNKKELIGLLDYVIENSVREEDNIYIGEKYFDLIKDELDKDGSGFSYPRGAKKKKLVYFIPEHEGWFKRIIKRIKKWVGISI